MTATTLLLAHQGGWDEVLLILTPIAIFAALLGLANRRANVEVRQRVDGGPTGPTPDEPPEGDAPPIGAPETGAPGTDEDDPEG